MSSRKTIRAAGALAAAVAAAFAGAVLEGPARGAQSTNAAADAGTAYLTADSFANPSQVDESWVRWNVPNNAVAAELQTELQQMADAGIAGAEVGQGGFPNHDQLVAMLSKANQVGIKLSLGGGVITTPAGMSLNDPYVRKTLVSGRTVVGAGATYTGAVPAGTPATTNLSTLVAVLAYRCTVATCPATGVVSLDQASVVDLTSTVTGRNTNGLDGGTSAGNVSWTAPATPANAQWLLLSFWMRGQTASPDLYSPEGTKLHTDYLDANLFPPDVKELARLNGGDIFTDSNAGQGGSPTNNWTNKFAQEFQARRGYSLIPYLPAIFPTNFNFAGDLAARVRNDSFQTRTDIWSQYRLKGFGDWTHTFNWNFRVQVSYSNEASTDLIQAAQAVDHPETESLYFRDIVDAYIPMASAGHMTGNNWVSTECCAVNPLSYAQNWQDTTTRLNKSYAGGVTKQVFHVYPYRDTPTSLWPGYHNFTQGFSNAWGPRNPYWVDANTYTGYQARVQQVVKQGSAKVDVAVYMQNYLWPANEAATRSWPDTGLERAGYTHDYLNPSLLDLPSATVSGGRLAAGGPAYKAFIIDSQQLPTAPATRTSMPVAVAQKALSFAKAGLPVIVVGTPPNQTPGLPGDDAALSALIAQLLAEPAVRQVANEAAVPAALAAVGVRPDAEPSSPSPVLNVHRADADTDYYWFYNQGALTSGYPNLIDPAPGSPADLTVSLVGKGRPYKLDPWSGRITPIADYTASGGRVSVRLKLAREDTAIIALTDSATRFPTSAQAVHATSTTADEVVYGTGGEVALRATQAGTYSTVLSNGRTVQTTVGNVPAAIDLTGATWHLSVEDWKPANPYTTTGTLATQTLKVPHELDVAGLKSWPNIPELADVSGIGTYTTTVNLPEPWNGGRGAYLSLGEVFDSFAVSVNGQAVPPVNQASGLVDVGPYLHAGTNAISVRVATTLRNRLRTLDNTQASRPRQPYGLVGPVVLTPYEQAGVFSSTDTPGSTGGTVPATLALTLGAPATFGAFTPGLAKDYAASTTANVISTAGDALLSVADPSSTATGHLVNGAFSLPSVLQAKASSLAGTGGAFANVGGSASPTSLLSYAGPVSNDPVTVAFQQHIGATDALRTGAYSKTLTFTLSTTTP